MKTNEKIVRKIMQDNFRAQTSQYRDYISDVILDALITKDKDYSELQDLAIWMTGCGYDFCKHKYFTDNRHLLSISDIESSEIELPVETET